MLSPRQLSRSRLSESLTELARALDLADAFRSVRWLVLTATDTNKAPSVVDVLTRVSGLVHLHATALDPECTIEDIREAARACGQPPTASDDSDGEAVIAATVKLEQYRQHSCALQHTFDVLRGVPEAEQQPRPFPDDVAVSTVIDRAKLIVEGLNRTADYGGTLRSLQPKLSPGWERTEETDERTGKTHARWSRAGSAADVEIEIGDAGPLADSIDVHPGVTLAELIAVLWTESRRLVIS